MNHAGEDGQKQLLGSAMNFFPPAFFCEAVSFGVPVSFDFVSYTSLDSLWISRITLISYPGYS